MLQISLWWDLDVFSTDPIHLHYASIIGCTCNYYASQCAWENLACWPCPGSGHNSPLWPSCQSLTSPSWTHRGQSGKVKGVGNEGGDGRSLLRWEARPGSTPRMQRWSQTHSATLRIMGKHGRRLITPNEVEPVRLRQLWQRLLMNVWVVCWTFVVKLCEILCMWAVWPLTSCSSVCCDSLQLAPWLQHKKVPGKQKSNRVKSDYFCLTWAGSSYSVTCSDIMLIPLSVIIPPLSSFYSRPSRSKAGAAVLQYNFIAGSRRGFM